MYILLIGSLLVCFDSSLIAHPDLTHHPLLLPQLDDAWFNAGSLEMEQGSNLTRAAALLDRAVCAVRQLSILFTWSGQVVD